jgi:hypothetical protein
MVIAMYYHMFPPAAEAAERKCTCAWDQGLTVAV